MPYNPSMPLSDQIHTSVASSLKNLSTGEDTYLDSIVLHSPVPGAGNTAAAIRTLKTYIASGKVRSVGIANCDLPCLLTLISDPDTIPSVVQNRFVERSGFDVAIRKHCRENGIIYQSFWTLTGNPQMLQWPEIGTVSSKIGVGKEVVLYALVMGLKGITVLNGTTNSTRMREDLDGVEKIGKWVESEGSDEWEEVLGEFGSYVGDVDE
jgi:diketogulonate reductase-like aldo/keto reductase